MSLDVVAMKRHLITWAKTYSGISESGRHIWAFQNSPQPSSPYVTLNITSGPTKIGNTDALMYNESNQTYDITGIRSFKVDINVFGSNAHNTATALSLSLERPEVQSFFRGVNITPYGSTPSVNNVTRFIDTIYEERSMFELTLSASYLIETSESFIGEVSAAGASEMEKGHGNKITIGGI
tara:strand:- start:212 stop:754 length:543 start_codon:yes stop_codon:yes gene_type:complete